MHSNSIKCHIRQKTQKINNFTDKIKNPLELRLDMPLPSCSGVGLSDMVRAHARAPGPWRQAVLPSLPLPHDSSKKTVQESTQTT